MLRRRIVSLANGACRRGRLPLHGRMCMRKHLLQRRQVLRSSNVAEYHACVSLEHRELRALDRAPLKRGDVILMRHHEDFTRERARAVARSTAVKDLTRLERLGTRAPAQTSRSTDTPPDTHRTHKMPVLRIASRNSAGIALRCSIVRYEMHFRASSCPRTTNASVGHASRHARATPAAIGVERLARREFEVDQQLRRERNTTRASD